jgi:hypothetical protein
VPRLPEKLAPAGPRGRAGVTADHHDAQRRGPAPSRPEPRPGEPPAPQPECPPRPAGSRRGHREEIATCPATTYITELVDYATKALNSGEYGKAAELIEHTIDSILVIKPEELIKCA